MSNINGLTAFTISLSAPSWIEYNEAIRALPVLTFPKNLAILLFSTCCVKNASTMVILNAERYGLSQIHQLRGRVGRGNTQSYCYLVTDKEQTERLQILERINDGFILAEEDFRLRGPGDFLGEEQSGFSSLNFDFESKDLNIWKCAVSDSKEYVLKVLGGLETNAKMIELLKNVKTKNNKLN